MQSWITVAEFPLHAQLQMLEQRLAEQGIEYRITADQHCQRLAVSDHNRSLVLAIIQREFAGFSSVNQKPGNGSLAQWLIRSWQQTPVVMLMLLLSIVGAAVVRWQFGWVHWLTFQDFQLVNNTRINLDTAEAAWQQGQYWRLLTPMFLHFGIFHVAFNGLWVWEFGRRIEGLCGSFHLLSLILVTSVLSNLCQYLWAGPSLFGGMSGVLYGLLGYIWIRHKLTPHPLLALPRGIVGFMLGWLLLCMTGVVDLVMRGSIANAAHAGGLVAGVVAGAVFGWMGRKPRER
jgi:GlpG protein